MSPLPYGDEASIATFSLDTYQPFKMATGGFTMRGQLYPDEFKNEAVKHVFEYSCSVTEVARRRSRSAQARPINCCGQNTNGST